MMYWSQGVKTEAYVAAPKLEQSYKLFVKCHGGYYVPLNQKHIVAFSTPDNPAFLLNQNILNGAPSNMISLFPMYQGYDKSEGTVHGLNSDTIDTQNAIKAVKAYFKSVHGRPSIEDGMVWLEGGSLGGGVVLKLASKRHDVVSVLAISSFIGWDIFGNWIKNHPGVRWARDLKIATKSYGPFNSDSKAFKLESINYKEITAPTLIIHGTADKVLPWQPVQIFYNKMKKYNKTVKFKLIKGGNHGLTNKSEKMNEVISNWERTLD